VNLFRYRTSFSSPSPVVSLDLVKESASEPHASEDIWDDTPVNFNRFSTETDVNVWLCNGEFQRDRSMDTDVLCGEQTKWVLNDGCYPQKISSVSGVPGFIIRGEDESK
jgi:hypothetical protein